MIRRPPRSTRTDTLFPYTTLFRTIPNCIKDYRLEAKVDGEWTLLDEVEGNHQRFRVHTRSEEHTTELQSLMRISYAVLCLKKNTPTAHAFVLLVLLHIHFLT